ncbi:biopolymer transporter ExbD [Lewinella sp. W8]|uniref:ExbD/TolR family protein n=1 Tax=Lewinella sp. W8 TaxID=2528208 RepID=UPI00106895DC|nr:biopolymer transporter ExbD [Lewinella sp. W8]MTB52607.1 biopolymer transporter ExbD [Lewinella sp. W8]
MVTKKTRREGPGVNAGSMADIAFLLLIFFLVTTTIAEDQGVLVKLPIWDDDPIKQDVVDKNVLTVIVNAADQLMIENERAQLAALPDMVRNHVISPERTPKQAVVSLTHDRGTSYRQYLEVYDALKHSYQVLWEEVASQRYGKAYDMLTTAEQRSIRDELPMIISEAEPSGHGKEL